MANIVTSYSVDFGDKFIKFMEQGFSITAVAGMLNIGRSTVYKWEKDHADFKEALDLARAKRLFHFEKKLMEYSDMGKPITGTIFALKNISRKEWGEKQADDELAIFRHIKLIDVNAK